MWATGRKNPRTTHGMGLMCQETMLQFLSDVALGGGEQSPAPPMLSNANPRMYKLYMINDCAMYLVNTHVITHFTRKCSCT